MATRWEAASTVAIACAVIAVPIAAQERPLHMRIVVQDFAALPPPVLGEAETVVTRIYSQIGVDIAWRNIAEFDAESIIHVGLLSAEMERRARPDRATLGIAIPGARLVRVFVGRVEFLARGAQEDTGAVLGHVIAHEIGHVLLGLGAHSTAGLMADMLDLPRIALGGLWFDHGQAAIIRTMLAGDGSVRFASRRKA